LAAQFAARHDVFAPSRAELDLLDDDAVSGYLERNRFDVVIHAATERSNRAIGSACGLLDRNCRMFFNLARNERWFGRMLFLSSGAVYSRAHWQRRMAEGYFDQHVPEDPYGFSKYVCAKAIGAMQRVYEMRLFGVFGPHEDWRVRFLSNACCRVLFRMPVLIRQNVFFDYLDVEDLGGILELFLTNAPQYRNYNVASGRACGLEDLAKVVVRAAGQRLDIRIRNSGMGTEYSADTSRLLAEIPGFSFRGIDDSIARLYRWYESRKQSIDPALLCFDE
jgi:GDP-L-fucose synthase